MEGRKISWKVIFLPAIFLPSRKACNWKKLPSALCSTSYAWSFYLAERVVPTAQGEEMINGN